MNVSTKYLSQFKTFSGTRRSPLGCDETGLPGSVDTFLRSALDALSLSTCASHAYDSGLLSKEQEEERKKKRKGKPRRNANANERV
ncbi:hypothetical protein WN48_05433 [Eufriesea mexicana]|nr:hypothetical protein WN48_05433 [Eufriesea mexicana]